MIRSLRLLLSIAATAVACLAAIVPAHAQFAPPPIAARAWLVVDVASGQVLAAQDPDAKTDPASLTKLMTAYLAFAALRDRKLASDARPPVSEAAWKAIGSRMFVDPGKPATVEELLHGMIIQSGNDASIILAEAIGGTEANFAQLMNREAQRLGMTNSQFRNATGLPDPQHYSTARDLATLAMRLIADHPQQYARLYSQKEYTYNNIRQPNRNRLLAVDPSVDGVKTGFTEAAGWCLVASARRDQPAGPAGVPAMSRRLLSVVLGTQSDAARAIESQKLLNWGFQTFDAVRVFEKTRAAGTYRVWKGSASQLAAGFPEDVVVSVPKGQVDKLKAEIERIEPLVAPIAAGQAVGTLRVKLGERVLIERPVLALNTVAEAGWFGRTWDGLRLMIAGATR